MPSTIARSVWKLLLFRGILAVLFGLLAIFLPSVTFATIILWLGAWLSISGLLMIIAAFQNRNNDSNWWFGLIAGIVSLLLGIYTFMRPNVTAAAVIIYLALMAIVVGIAEIVFAIRVRKVIQGEGWLIAGGAVSVLFGVLLLSNPIGGGVTLTLLLGFYALILGIFLLMLAFRIRKYGIRG
ncbi:HdeD family acid-resistance protein [Flavihumibacter petaseus]|uniref:HdeD family acid-resistance protein n=1 Tax=Flavihumibacter petaseus NBRC 106054 TaxID=1220578 RepID=A0A0E9N4W8_9BACT|nr:HdeD family acid-resistance protein [Flavihumibacter petaseus]GAO44390.1 hypothetical protein FPE01S_03_04280 [Flavihumibacter petaseus NBRC 106054]